MLNAPRTLLLISAIGLCITFFLAFATDPRARADDESLVAAPSQTKLKAVAVVPRDWPPQYSTDKAGKPTGFAIDTLEAVAAIAGVTITYKIVESFPEAAKTLEDGGADLIPNVGIFPQRLATSSFTAPLETFLVSIFARNNTQDLPDEASLTGRKLAVVDNNIGMFMFGKRADIDISVFPDVRTALFELLAGNVDALIYPQSVLLALARGIGVEDRIKVAGEPLKEIKRGIQVRKENAALLSALDAAVQSYVRTTDYQDVYTKWYGKPSPYWTTIKVVWFTAGFVAITILMAAAWHYFSILRLNRALAESEQRFNAFARHTPGLQSIKDIQGRYIQINATSEAMFGATNEEVRGKTAAAVFSPEATKIFTERDRTVIETGEPVEAEETYEMADGQHTYLTVKFPIYGANGEITAVGLSGHDITDRRKAEEALRASEESYKEIIEGTDELITVVDTEGNFQFVNHAAQRVFGLPPDQCPGLSAFSFIHPDDRELTMAAFRQWLDNKEPTFRHENRQQSRDGSVRHMMWNISARFDDNGKIENFLGFASDITDRKLAEINMQAALVDAEQANQAKSEFLATMSHEFRTPLNAILGFSEMLRAQYFGPLGATNYLDYANDIHTSGQLMLALINDMLDIAAIEAGKRQITYESLDIGKLLKDCVRNFEPAAQENNILMRLDVPETCPPIYTDKRSATQIFLNLLSNAVKFTERDGTITLSVTEQDGEVAIKVSDTGVGIPADKLLTVTNPFAQTHSNPHISQKGTGLGLTIVKALVETLGGSLLIESEFGKGTDVTVTFRISQRTYDGDERE